MFRQARPRQALRQEKPHAKKPRHAAAPGKLEGACQVRRRRQSEQARHIGDPSQLAPQMLRPVHAEHQERLLRRQNGKGMAIPGTRLQPGPDAEPLVVESEKARDDGPLELDGELPVASEELKLVLGSPVGCKPVACKRRSCTVSQRIEAIDGPPDPFLRDQDVEILRLPAGRVAIEHHGQGRPLEGVCRDAARLERVQDPGELRGKKKRPRRVVVTEASQTVHGRRGDCTRTGGRKGPVHEGNDIVPLAEPDETVPVHSLGQGRRRIRPVFRNAVLTQDSRRSCSGRMPACLLSPGERHRDGTCLRQAFLQRGGDLAVVEPRDHVSRG